MFWWVVLGKRWKFQRCGFGEDLERKHRRPSRYSENLVAHFNPQGSRVELTLWTVGALGANNVPDILKPVEILGIIQARKWNVASLNEFRQFFHLKSYETFEEINPDPYIATTLKDFTVQLTRWKCIPECSWKRQNLGWIPEWGFVRAKL